MLTIKIIGPGCERCNLLEREVINVLAELNVAADIEHVRDISKFQNYNVAGTPALIINGSLKSMGKVPSRNELKMWIRQCL